MTWHPALYETLLAHEISVVAHVPDAAHAPLIDQCVASSTITTVTLTTEQDGVGLLCGAWAGGRRGVLLMQSSGVGNCVNALALAAITRAPLVAIISMRGEWGEFIPWQVPMGQATPAVLEAMDVTLFRAVSRPEVAEVADAALSFAFNTRRSVAVLLSQRLIGAKQFEVAP